MFKLSLQRICILLAALAVAGLLLVVGTWAVQRWVEQQLQSRVTRALAGSSFTLTWQELQVRPWSGVRCQGLELREGKDVLAKVALIAVQPAWSDLLTGHPRARHVLVDQPQLWLRVGDGQPIAWQRLRQTIAHNRLQKQGESSNQGLRRYTDQLTVQGGQGHVQLLGWLAVVADHADLADLQADLQLTQASSTFSGQVSGALGQAVLRGALRQDLVNPKDWRAEVELEPPLHVAPHLLSTKTLRGLNWSVGGGVLDGKSLTVKQIRAWNGADDPAILVGDVRVLWPTPSADATPDSSTDSKTSPMQVQAHAIAVDVPAALWPATVPEPWRLPAQLQVGAVELALDPSASQVVVRDVLAHLRGVRAKVPQVDIVISGKSVGKIDTWQRVSVKDPQLDLGNDAPLWTQDAKLWPTIAQLAQLRMPVPVTPETDTEDDAEDAEPPPAPKPVAQPTDNKLEKPSTRWTHALQAGYTRLLSLSEPLHKAWQVDRLPPTLQLSILGAGLAVHEGPLSATPGPLLWGVHRATLTLDGQGSERTLAVSAQPMDRLGDWGRLALVWQRLGPPQVGTAQAGPAGLNAHDRGHQLDFLIQGAGMAQLLGARLPGLHVGDSAHIDLHGRAVVADRQHLHVDAQLDVSDMGIDWWRLSPQPIADFRARASLVLDVNGKTHNVTLRVPEATLGGDPQHGDPGAKLNLLVDLTHMDTWPHIDLQVGAPMQDCQSMLHAVPPSLTPTIGRIDAHGTMDWRFGFHTSLQSVGAVQVDLALGDTLCTFDHFEKLDLQEMTADFDRPVNENGVLLDDVHIGPGSGSWTPLEQIPEFVSYVMWCSEDSFYSHRGISESLLEKALAIDLSYGRFIYGGSTLTQQLVKNLYLKRNKALSRKFEEMLIVWQMEKVVGKKRILEIYCNGVEFGPKVYGITRAAQAFYQKTPGQLLPEEAVYLAIIKPSPRSGYGTMRGDGWGQWYFDKSKKYMDKLLGEHSISQAAYDAAAAREFKPMFNPPARTGDSVPKGRGH